MHVDAFVLWPDVSALGWLVSVPDSWLNSTCSSLRINVPNLGCTFDPMHLITLFPGSSAFRHRYFCLPHLSRRLILRSWQSFCRSLRPQSTLSFPPVSLSYCCYVTTLLFYSLWPSALWCHCSETQFPPPRLLLSRKPTETETSCILKIQFYVLCRSGGCKSSFSLFLHHLWWCNLSAFPVLSGRIFC